MKELESSDEVVERKIGTIEEDMVNNNEMMMGNNIGGIVVIVDLTVYVENLVGEMMGTSVILSTVEATWIVQCANFFLRLGLCHLKLSSQGPIFARVTLMRGTR